MKNKFNTLHKFIYEYSSSECTKETLNGLFRSVIEPIVSEPKAQACILLKLDDTKEKESLLKRLTFAEREIFSFNNKLSILDIKNVCAENIWEEVNFLIISAKRYSAALLWDYSISETKNTAKTLLLVNSKIVTDILKTVLDNSIVENKKEIVQKYNADRRENVLLNKAINNIVSVLNDKTDEFITKTIENKALYSENNNLKTAETVSENAKLTAHEIKNNLSVINLYTTIIKKRNQNISGSEEEKKSLENALLNITNASENISYAINELREISLPKNENVNLFDLIKKTVDMTREKAAGRGTEITVEGDKTTEIYTDKAKLTSVIQNVLINATEACKENGKTNIKISDTAITISNNGEKIPEELYDKIFEKEFTSKKDGNGLGLYICKKIMNILNGDINLLSSNNNQTVFEISFKK